MTAGRLGVPAFVPTAEFPAAAIVVGEELSALGALRSLTAAGVPCFVATTKPGRDCMTTRHGIKLPIRSYVGDDLLGPLERLAARLGGPAVLLPTNDAASVTLSAARERLAGPFRFCLPPHDLLLAMNRKEDFQQRAEALGCPVPRTVHLRNEEHLDAIAGLTFPCIVKPGCRDPAYDAQFAKAYLMEEPGETIALVRQMLKTLPDIIVQEYINGPNDSIHFCLQYRRADGRVLASFTGRKLRSIPPGLGLTASCLAAPEAAAELEALTERFFGGIGMVGLCSMEFKRDARRGNFLMVEPTVGRFDWQEEVASVNGINIPLAAWRDLAGLPPLTFPADRRIGWRNSFAHWHSSWLGRADAPRFPAGLPVVDAHWRLDDPLPALAETYGWLRRRIARLFGSGNAA